MKINSSIEMLMKNNGLGSEIKSIIQLSGGLMHKMFKAETDKGIIISITIKKLIK